MSSSVIMALGSAGGLTDVTVLGFALARAWTAGVHGAGTACRSRGWANVGVGSTVNTGGTGTLRATVGADRLGKIPLLDSTVGSGGSVSRFRASSGRGIWALPVNSGMGCELARPEMSALRAGAVVGKDGAVSRTGARLSCRRPAPRDGVGMGPDTAGFGAGAGSKRAACIFCASVGADRAKGSRGGASVGTDAAVLRAGAARGALDSALPAGVVAGVGIGFDSERRTDGRNVRGVTSEANTSADGEMSPSGFVRVTRSWVAIA